MPTAWLHAWEGDIRVVTLNLEAGTPLPDVVIIRGPGAVGINDKVFVRNWEGETAHYSEALSYVHRE